MTNRRCLCACARAVSTPPAPGLLSVFQTKTSRRGSGCCLCPGPGSGLCPLLEHSSSSYPCRLSCLRQLVRTLPALGVGPRQSRHGGRAGIGAHELGDTIGQLSSLGNGDTSVRGARVGRPLGCGVLGPEAPGTCSQQPSLVSVCS